MIKEFLPHWTGDLAYVFGVLESDGSACLCRDRGVISLICKDYDFAEAFKISLERVLQNKVFLYPYSRGGWQVYKTSKPFVVWYNSLNTIKIEEELKSDRKFVASYLRGVFDGDGSATPRRDTIYSTSYGLLKMLQRLLDYLSIRPTRIRLHYKAGVKTFIANKLVISRKPMYSLNIQAWPALANFRTVIGSNIPRKQLSIPPKPEERKIISSRVARSLPRDEGGRFIAPNAEQK